MFRRALQPTYSHLNRKFLIEPSQQIINSNCLKHQRRFFIKTILKNENKPKLKLFLVSFASGLALITYYDYRKEKPTIFQIKTSDKQWDSIQRKMNDDLIGDSLVGNYLDASILDKLSIDKSVEGRNKLPGKRLILLQ